MDVKISVQNHTAYCQTLYSPDLKIEGLRVNLNYCSSRAEKDIFSFALLVRNNRGFALFYK